jgi:putative ABC transport system permease protein
VSRLRIDLRLAVRNVFRNTRRSVITLAAIVFGASAIVVFGGFVEYMYLGVREQTIRSQFGHIQLHRRGHAERGAVAPFELLIPDYEAVRALIAPLEHVVDVLPRLGFSGLISTGDTTTSFLGLGVDPEREAALSSFARTIEGAELSGAAPRGIILGLGLARGFGVQPGDEVTLLATTRDGGINGLAVTVRGIWESTEKAYDDRFLKAPIASVQRLLDAEGVVQSIVVLLDDTEHTAVVRQRIEALVAARGLPLEIQTWEDLALRYHQVRALFSRIFNTLTVIVSVIVVLGIANTMTMAVFERTREIGTIMALGARRRRVVGMFVVEGAFLGVVGGLLGLAVGVVLARAISAYGIQMPPPPGSTRGFVAEILLVPEIFARAFVLSVATAIASSLYPAWRASRLDVVEALRQS